MIEAKRHSRNGNEEKKIPISTSPVEVEVQLVLEEYGQRCRIVGKRKGSSLSENKQMERSYYRSQFPSGQHRKLVRT